MAPPFSDKVLEHSEVAPPQGSVSATRVPLTFFDLHWLLLRPMQRIIFYEFPYPPLHFTQTVLPNLKHSLSLTLCHFFTLPGKLRCSLPPDMPYISYNEGDSVSVKVVESDTDFNYLTSNQARDDKMFRSLVPALPMTNIEQMTPIMAIQITIFPKSCISIGLTFNHVAADGRSFSHFIKSWASIYRSGGEALTSLQLPCYNKDLIKEPHGFSSILLKDVLNSEYSGSPADTIPQDDVRITLVLRRSQIENLKEWVTTRIRHNSKELLEAIRISTFVVTCGFMWVSLLKLQGSDSSHELDNDLLYYFLAAVDCRERFGLGIPATYFGNCLANIVASAKRSELIGENGVAIAARAIAKTINELEIKGPLLEADKWNSRIMEIVKLGRVVSVASSPKLRYYDIDFGWGRPKKIEVAHIGPYGAFSLHELRDEEGGIEIGLVLGRHKLELCNELFSKEDAIEISQIE